MNPYENVQSPVVADGGIDIPAAATGDVNSLIIDRPGPPVDVSLPYADHPPVDVQPPTGPTPTPLD